MADEKDSAPRARPFTPPLPPFRGQASVARSPASSLTPPEARRGSLVIGTRAAPKASVEPEAGIVEIARLTIDPAVAETAAAMPSQPAPADADSPRAQAIAATEAMPWLFTDPATADRRPTPVAPLAGIAGALIPSADDAAPEEAAQALAGLPFIDQSGAAHEAQLHPAVARPSGKMHRVGFDAAAVLESVAARVRAGALDVRDVDPAAGEAAALATVLAAMLRARGR